MSDICVVPLVPIRDNPHHESMECLNQMCLYADKQGITVRRPSFRRGSSVHINRNMMIADLIASGMYFSHILFMDDDMTTQPDALVKLLSHNVDIVGGLCTCRQDPPIPNARMWNEEEQHWEELWSFPDGLIEVGGVGTGLMLISLNALQQVGEVYFQCLYEKDVWKMPEDRAKEVSEQRAKSFNQYPNAWWFRWLAPPTGSGENGEDMSFCWAAKRYADLKVHVDTTVRPGHLGNYPYSIADFLAHRESAMQKAEREGRLKVRPKPHLSPIETAPPTSDNSDLVQLIEG